MRRSEKGAKDEIETNPLGAVDTLISLFHSHPRDASIRALSIRLTDSIFLPLKPPFYTSSTDVSLFIIMVLSMSSFVCFPSLQLHHSTI